MKVVYFLLICISYQNCICQSFIGFRLGSHIDYFVPKEKEVTFYSVPSYNVGFYYNYQPKSQFSINATIQYKVTNIEYQYLLTQIQDAQIGQNYHTLISMIGSAYSISVKDNILVPELNLGFSWLIYRHQYASGNFKFDFNMLENSNSKNYIFPLVQTGLNYRIKFRKKDIYICPNIHFAYIVSNILSKPFISTLNVNNQIQRWSGGLFNFNFGVDIFLKL